MNICRIAGRERRHDCNKCFVWLLRVHIGISNSNSYKVFFEFPYESLMLLTFHSTSNIKPNNFLHTPTFQNHKSWSVELGWNMFNGLCWTSHGILKSKISCVDNNQLSLCLIPNPKCTPVWNKRCDATNIGRSDN